MTALAKQIATALIFCVGAGGTLGCELISTIDRSKISDTSSSGGTGGEPGTTSSTSGSTGGAGGGTGGATSSSTSSSSSGTGGMAVVCGDGDVGSGEGCDDGNTVSGDGCDPLCEPEQGFDCTGSPSVCKSTCGDGKLASNEACDDGNTAANDGCDAACKLEAGATCTGMPSVCTPVCGDGLVTLGEACDDKNLTAGDGCDATCKVEPGTICSGTPSACTPICGDGLVTLGEACDDGNLTAGDGCNATCVPEAGYTCTGAPSVCTTICGDGIKVGAEACDDGNLVNLDGCSSTCHVDSFTETGSNDTVATANGPYTPNPGLIIHGTIQPGTDADVFAIVVPATADLHLETFDASGPSTCNNIDTQLTLIGTDGTTVIATDDDAGVNACSKIDSKGSPAVAHLPAGTYYVKVEAYNNFKPIPGYTLVVTFDALCGDAKKQGHEECDGGATCTATCDRVPTCGDGFVDAPEQCDDANAASGDGCSATCQYETQSETEPNDTAATASGPFKPSALLSGAITPGTDLDYFKITVPATADLKIQTFDATGPSSCAAIDTVVTLYGTDGTTTLVTRDQGGVNGCGAIDSTKAADSAARHLAAGTYFIKVEDFQNNTVIPGYTMLVTFNALCGDGVVSGSEECDGGAGCTATCDRVAVCGDGFVDAPESCDDGNTTAGDGCSATCAFETTAETEPNDTSATANGPFSPYALITAAITPGTDVDYFKVVLTATSDLDVETFDGKGPGSCSGVDTVVTLYAADGTTEVTSADDGGISTCSRIDPTVDPLARHLAAGTYFIKVEDFQNNTLIPAYMLQIKATAICGNGKVEGGEECDGGAGCTATCDRIAVCGDGFIDAPETCDDGNTTAGDGCGATCLLETTAEVEPNDDLTGADASPVQITASTVITGAISPALDEDFFKMTLAQPTIVRLETFDPSGTDCSIMTTLAVYDSVGALLYTDDNSGISTCSAVVVSLPVGSYYVSVVERTGSLPIAGYLLQAKFEASAGFEVEPNDTGATATNFPGSDVVIGGNHALGTDSDYFKITVPAGKSLRAEIVEGNAETCESDDIDSFVTLFDSNGVALGGDDDSGRGFCSLIDGTGATPADDYAHNLPAGTYYLLVEAAPGAQAVGDTTGQFIYNLAITLR
jgi:cysteine-rich repeat protein